MRDDNPAGFLTDCIFEVIPMKTAFDKAAAVPNGAAVSVTASPDKGMGATVDLSVRLAEQGMRVIPHISARGTKTREELAGIVRRLAAVGVEQIFVVGGDADNPGDFHDALDLLTALESLGRPFRAVGVAGYPEGHPTIPEERLIAALIDKLPHASYIATQLCFDASAIRTWIHGIRAAGVDLPVFLGIPGAVDSLKLLRIGTRIGVGRSLRYLRKNRKAIKTVMFGGATAAADLIAELGPDAAELGIQGLHIFTFNAVAETAAWWEDERSGR